MESISVHCLETKLFVPSLQVKVDGFFRRRLRGAGFGCASPDRATETGATHAPVVFGGASMGTDPLDPRAGSTSGQGVRERVRNASPGRWGEAGGGVQNRPHGPAEGGHQGCRDRRRAVLARGVQRGVELPSGPSERRQGVQGERRAMTLPRVAGGVSSPLRSRGRRGVRGSAPANGASGMDAPQAQECHLLSE